MEEESQLPRVLEEPPETCWGRDLLGPPEALGTVGCWLHGKSWTQGEVMPPFTAVDTSLLESFLRPFPTLGHGSLLSPLSPQGGPESHRTLPAKLVLGVWSPPLGSQPSELGAVEGGLRWLIPPLVLGFVASQATELGKQSRSQAPHPHSLVNSPWRWEMDTGRFGDSPKSIEECRLPHPSPSSACFLSSLVLSRADSAQ